MKKIGLVLIILVMLSLSACSLSASSPPWVNADPTSTLTQPAEKPVDPTGESPQEGEGGVPTVTSAAPEAGEPSPTPTATLSRDSRATAADRSTRSRATIPHAHGHRGTPQANAHGETNRHTRADAN